MSNALCNLLKCLYYVRCACINSYCSIAAFYMISTCFKQNFKEELFSAQFRYIAQIFFSISDIFFDIETYLKLALSKISTSRFLSQSKPVTVGINDVFLSYLQS